MITIQTEFGKVEVSEEAFIHFEEGLYGFESVKDYVLIAHDEQNIIMSLQPVKERVPQFLVLDPYALVRGFNPELSAADLEWFGVTSCEELKFLVIAVVKENYVDTVVNLKSPIVIDPKTNRAKQVFLENKDYSMKYRVFDDKEGC
jgi:flagellar assembly factor FliW